MSPGEGGLTLSERIAKIEANGDATLALVRELDSRDRADLQRHHSHERRLASLESWQTWATRLIVGAVALGVLSLVWITG